MGSRAPIAITFLVKNPGSKEKGKIFFHDIGDYLTRKEKLSKINALGKISSIESANGWSAIKPDTHGDWFDQRSDFPEPNLLMGGKGLREVLFSSFSLGIKTNRDAWVYNDSRNSLIDNVRKTISFYNSTVDNPGTKDINNPTKISWSGGLTSAREARRKQVFDENAIGIAMYRPFNLRFLYYDRTLIERMYRMRQLFPRCKSSNLAICVTGISATVGFSALMTKYIPDLSCLSVGQCFPLIINSDAHVGDGDSLMDAGGNKCSISDSGLLFFQTFYKKEGAVSKEDLFYYTYGLLHSEEYRSRFASNIKKEIPRIFPVGRYECFRTFVKAGRALGKLHCDFEEAEMHPVQLNKGETPLIAPTDPANFYRVEKMKFAGKRPNLDKTTVIYNSNITISGIPIEAYDYAVNGKPALEWVMERQRVTTDKDSGIVNDPNAFANEARGNPAYPLELFQRVITVSLETMKIVKSLPPLDLED